MTPTNCIAGAPANWSGADSDTKPIVIELTPDEAWALVSAVRPMCIAGKQGIDVAWVQQRVFNELQARMAVGIEDN